MNEPKPSAGQPGPREPPEKNPRKTQPLSAGSAGSRPFSDPSGEAKARPLEPPVSIAHTFDVVTSRQDMEKRSRERERFVALQKNLFTLCNATYKATKKPPPTAQLRKLVKSADALLTEYRTLIAESTGGKLDAVKSCQPNIESLEEFTQTLRETLGERDSGG